MSDKDTIIPTDYKWGEKVTRENFTSMYSMTFALSKGRLISQKAVLEYLRLHFRFDYRRTFFYFLINGGFNELSQQEQERFNQDVQSIRRHAEYYEHPLSMGTITWRADHDAENLRTMSRLRTLPVTFGLTRFISKEYLIRRTKRYQKTHPLKVD